MLGRGGLWPPLRAQQLSFILALRHKFSIGQLKKYMCGLSAASDTAQKHRLVIMYVLPSGPAMLVVLATTISGSGRNLDTLFAAADCHKMFSHQSDNLTATQKHHVIICCLRPLLNPQKMLKLFPKCWLCRRANSLLPPHLTTPLSG